MKTLIEKAITEKTKAIVVMHYAGVACAMDKIMNLADKFKLWVIEDAAQAMLSKHKNKYLGAIGHFGCLSFHETKNIISGEGGALLINDTDLIERAEIILEKGTDRKAILQRPGEQIFLDGYWFILFAQRTVERFSVCST